MKENNMFDVKHFIDEMKKDDDFKNLVNKHNDEMMSLVAAKLATRFYGVAEEDDCDDEDEEYRYNRKEEYEEYKDWEVEARVIREEAMRVKFKGKLKPCPFCGDEEAPLVCKVSDVRDYGNKYDRSHYCVICDVTKGGCGSMTGVANNTTEQSVSAWNKRTEQKYFK